MTFYKASSFGNDFIVVAEGELASAMPRRPLGESGRGADRGSLARDICDRQRGVGADGVVYFTATRDGAVFRIFNRDGGAAELSGNGMAALAAVRLRRRSGGASLTLRSGVGPRRVALLARRGAEYDLDVEIGRPDFSRRDFFPFLKRGRGGYRAAGVEFHPVSVGNPHAVVVCRRLPAAARLLALGARLERHSLFPRRANVEFVQASGRGRCRVFFYERGVGPTQASSTGSAAVFAVLRRLGLAGDSLEIESAAAAGGAGQDGPIRLHWREGIHVQTRTRLICKGQYFPNSA
ncbi:MAG TPA: diaminopimelate epimerase [Candidatus Aminicenantes bacterium]|nr:diaminopimelate epimerase [Candidatus Aminicenantes bacterium]